MRSLQAKMFLVFALIATLPLLALSYLALAETRQALAQEVGSAHEDVAGAAAGFVGVYVENGRVLLEGSARAPALRAALEQGDAEALGRALEDLQRSGLSGQGRAFEAVYVLDGRGEVVAHRPPEAPVEGPRPAVAAAMAEAPPGRVVQLAPPPGGSPVLPLAIVAPTEGAERFTLVAELGLVPLGAALQAFSPGDARAVYLTDATGRVLFHPDRAVLAERPLWGEVPPVARGLREERGFLEHVDASGADALAAFARVPSVGWVVVSSVPVEEAYAALQRLTAVLVVLSGLLAGGILLASVIVARRIVRPVEELTDAARALSEGKLQRRIRSTGRDEIGQLGAAFNEMAARIGESLEGLRRSEARYRNLVESANDLIFTIQPDGAVSFVSPLVQDLLGWRPNEVTGRPAAQVVHPADAALFQEAIEGVLSKGEPVFFVPHRLLAKDGTLRAVLTTFSPIFEGGGSPARVLGVARDVTLERRQELIREKAFQMARLVSGEAGLQPLATRGLELLLDVVALRQGAAYIGSGETLREVATLGPAMPPDARDALRALAAQATSAREPRRGPIPGGSALALPLLERGEPLGAAVLVDDVQGLRGESLDVLAALASQLAVGLRRSLFEARLQGYAAELETRVAERTRELTEKSQEMESFLYSVSHDLKAPLISIQGYAQSLEEDFGAQLAEDGRFFLERIRRNATLMESLILDILELSRIGRIREHPEDVDVGALLAGISGRLGDRFAQAGGSLVVAPGLPGVRGERNRLDQLFTNLVDNALKYRHPARPPRVEVTGGVVDGEARFQVRDNGRGIPERYQAQLFNVFQRVPAVGMDDPGGTGMGLAIVKRIADTHGGRVWVESEEGKGATFHVAFPLREG